MIFPKGWQTSSGRASGSAKHKLMRKDPHIVSVDNYYENSKINPLILFTTANTGGVNIVLWNYKHDNKGKVDFYEYGVFKEKRDLLNWNKNKIDLTIIKKVASISKKFMDKIITGRNYYGINSFLTTDANREGFDKISTEPIPNSIKFYGIDQNKNYKFFWLPKNQNIHGERRKINENNINLYKVAFNKIGAYKTYRSNSKNIYDKSTGNFVLKPGEAFSDVFVCVFFKTLNEAKNFQTYLKTYLYRYLLNVTSINLSSCSISHRNVPDLSEVKNPRTNKIGWNSDWTNEDLKKIFNSITDNEWEYIKEQALKSDGGKQ